MRFLKLLLITAAVAFVTFVTQIGGLILLLSLFAFGIINRKLTQRWVRAVAKVFSFVALYLICTFTLVPLIAKQFGRVPLPVFETHHLKPGNVWTCLLNRNYVRPALRDAAFTAAEKLNEQYPGSTVNYLDANFPFMNGFALLPHLSHSDGKKLDLSFQYNDATTALPTDEIPSFIGYGICEEPKPGEVNKPKQCADKGFGQYNLLRDLVPQGNKSRFLFDGERTRALVNAFADQPAIGKIFIEPHLKTRLAIKSAKVRFHGCQAVRHDDHIHIQLR